MELWERFPGWRHIGMDLPGHGSSLPLSGTEGLTSLARKIGALALRQGARHLVGLSFGTVIALQIALQYPNAFATLTLGSPILGGGPFDPEIWTRYKVVKALFRETGYGPNICDLWMGPGASLFSGVEARPQLREQLRRPVIRHPWWELADDAYLRLWHTPQTLKEFRGLGLATLLLVGEEDCDAIRQCAYLLQQVVSGCQRCDLPGLGHLCLLEEPARVQPIIEQHWRAHQSLPTRGLRSSDHAADD
jgi:pimeloyl-ACP methyl ester carboxylesterase